MLEELIVLADESERATALYEGASLRDIEEVESSIGTVFPPELKNLYMEANGETGKLIFSKHLLRQIFEPFDFLSLSRMVDSHKLHREAYPYYFGELNCCPNEYIKNEFFNSKWIPFGQADGGIYLAVDMDPDKKGQYGQVIMYGADALPIYCVLSPDLNAFIKSVSLHLTHVLQNRKLIGNVELYDDYQNMAYEFYESGKWCNYSPDEYSLLLNSWDLPFWHK